MIFSSYTPEKTAFSLNKYFCLEHTHERRDEQKHDVPVVISVPIFTDEICASYHPRVAHLVGTMGGGTGTAQTPLSSNIQPALLYVGFLAFNRWWNHMLPTFHPLFFLRFSLAC